MVRWTICASKAGSFLLLALILLLMLLLQQAWKQLDRFKLHLLIGFQLLACPLSVLTWTLNLLLRHLLLDLLSRLGVIKSLPLQLLHLLEVVSSDDVAISTSIKEPAFLQLRQERLSLANLLFASLH